MRITNIHSIINNKGFSLIELVLVIVLLGILSVGVSGFLSMGSQIFIDVKNRTALVSTARFAIERVNRDLRSAVPNSLRISESVVQQRQCIEFTPIIAAASYLDIPALPGDAAASNLRLIDFGDDERALMEGNNVPVVVYPLEPDDLYGITSKVKNLNNISFDTANDPEWLVSFSSSVQFDEDSPTSNIFFIGTPISYCVKDGELRRFVGGNPNDYSGVFDFNGVLMADHLFDADGNSIFPFQLNQDAQFRNATVIFLMQLTRNGETVAFNNEIHIPNAP